AGRRSRAAQPGRRNVDRISRQVTPGSTLPLVEDVIDTRAGSAHVIAPAAQVIFLPGAAGRPHFLHVLVVAGAEVGELAPLLVSQVQPALHGRVGEDVQAACLQLELPGTVQLLLSENVGGGTVPLLGVSAHQLTATGVAGLRIETTHAIELVAVAP